MSKTTEGEERPMEARTGRDNQRYGTKGERLVAGVVPLSPSRTHVLLISSTRRNGLVLPKGGWETDESLLDAAKREAWEEAGITLVESTVQEVGTINDQRNQDQIKADNAVLGGSGNEAPRARYHFFEGVVAEEADKWPEMGKRSRVWLEFEEAEVALRHRPELRDALVRSNLKRKSAA